MANNKPAISRLTVVISIDIFSTYLERTKPQFRFKQNRRYGDHARTRGVSAKVDLEPA